MNLLVIGEVLIDFIPSDNAYNLRIGGAPLNVLGAYNKLGGNGYIISQVGNDEFGNMILDYLNSNNINTKYININNDKQTMLAFLFNKESGRVFNFYNTDILDYNNMKLPSNIDIFHFSSLALKYVNTYNLHLEIIDKLNPKLISFDFNVRPAFITNKAEFINKINNIAKYADILKISEEDISYINNEYDLNYLKQYLNDKTKLILFTRGAKGAYLITKEYIIDIPAYNKIEVIDETGAGDGYIGSFLYNLAESNFDFSLENLIDIAKFSSIFSALSITKIGTLEAYPTKEEVIDKL